MNRRQLLFILAALVVMGAACLVLVHRERDSWDVPEAKMGDKVLPHFQPNDVAAITIQGEGLVHLDHTNGEWRVRERNGYPANFHQISDILIKLKNLKVVEAETVEPSQLSRVDLSSNAEPPAGPTLVELRDGQGRVLQSLLLGKRHLRQSSPSPMSRGSADGRYILLTENPREVLLISDALAVLQPSPAAWLSRDLFKAAKLQSIRSSGANGDNWAVSRDNYAAPWVLAEAKSGETLDLRKINAAEDDLSNLSFTDVQPAVNGSNQIPARVITGTAFDKSSYQIKIYGGPKDQPSEVAVEFRAGQNTAKAASQDLSQWIYKINPWIIAPLVRERAEMMEAAFEPTPAAVDSSGPTSPYQIK